MNRSKSKYRLAVALDYESGVLSVPVVSVHGAHELADKMVGAARRSGVPVVENDALARMLNELPRDSEIPADLFEAVALVLNEIDKGSRRQCVLKRTAPEQNSPSAAIE